MHDKSLPDENLRYRIFDFANRVVKYSNLPDGLQDDVLDRCASILFYDHGYKGKGGMSRFDRTWKARLESSYQTGGDLHPLRGRYKGRERFVIKFDAENPGAVLKCFREAQKVIGNQASFADLAVAMNAKAEKEGWTLKGENFMKIAKNIGNDSTNLFHCLGKQATFNTSKQFNKRRNPNPRRCCSKSNLIRK